MISQCQGYIPLSQTPSDPRSVGVVNASNTVTQLTGHSVFLEIIVTEVMTEASSRVMDSVVLSMHLLSTFSS